MIIPAPRRPARTASQLIHRLLRAAWEHGYIAVPRDAITARPTVLLTPRAGAPAARRGRLHLAPTGEHASLRWHWSDTGEALQASPTEPIQILAEIDAQLTPGRAAR